jgi:hypothetical protein
MRYLKVLSLVGLAVLGVGWADAADKAGKSSREGWPDTRAGAMGRRWVAAFSSGDSAMRDFYAREVARESVAKRDVQTRVERYRTLRERYGKLSFASVVESKPYELAVKLMATDASMHVFIFTVQPEPPHKLISVGIRERAHGHPGGFGGH